jgi:hypothetical protein
MSSPKITNVPFRSSSRVICGQNFQFLPLMHLSFVTRSSNFCHCCTHSLLSTSAPMVLQFPKQTLFFQKKLLVFVSLFFCFPSKLQNRLTKTNNFFGKKVFVLETVVPYQLSHTVHPSIDSVCELTTYINLLNV